MDSAVIAALVTAVVGGLFILLQKFVDKKYNRAKEALDKNSADVENMTKVVNGFESLNEQYRTRIQELEDDNKELEDKITQLQKGVSDADKASD